MESFLEKELRKHSGGCSECFKPMIITICNELGTLYRGTGQFGKAEEIFAVARDNIITHLGKDTLEYATILNNMAGNERLAGDLEKAEKSFLESARIYEKVIGRDNPLYCSLLNNLALLYMDQGRLEEAGDLLNDALDLKTGLGDSDSDKAVTLGNLGALYLRKGDLEKAEECLEEGIRLYSGPGGGEQVHLAALFNTLGAVLLKKNDPEKALEAYEKARDLTEKHFGRNHEYDIVTRNIEYIKDAVKHKDPD